MNRRTKKIVSVVLTFAMALTMVVGMGVTSFGDTFSWQAPSTAISGDPNETYITVSAHRAAQTISEILGLTNTCGQNLGGDAVGLVDGIEVELPGFNDSGEPVTLEGGSHTPILGIFGSDLNDNPDPYYYNYFYNLYASENGLTQSDNAIYYIPAKCGPNNADTLASTVAGHEGEITSLIRRPDILIGTTKTNDVGYDEELAALPENSDEDTTNDYAPVQFSYKYQTIYEIASTMKKLAAQMHTVAENTNKIWRYDDPATIAGDYEKYIVGLSAYVKAELAKKGVAEKTIAIVDPAHSDVSGAGTFRAYDDTCTSAVAKTCRITESVAQATVNIADQYKEAQPFTSTISGSDEAAFYLTADQILDADVIITCGIQSDTVVSTDSFKAELMELTGCSESDIPKIIDTQPDCIYGLHVNSSESAVGVGYFLGAIYGDEIDFNPVYASAYFYQKLMHINDPDALQTAIRNNLSNAVQSLGTGVTTDLTNYNAAVIENDIIEGMHYYEANPGEFNLIDERATSDKEAVVHTVDFDWTTGIGSTATNAINIIANGKTVDCASLGQDATIINSRTMIPLRAVANAIGVDNEDIVWDGATKTVTINNDGKTVSLAIGSADLKVDGAKKATLDSPAVIANGRTMVPVRAIAEAFDKSVNWNGHSRTVIIK